MRSARQHDRSKGLTIAVSAVSVAVVTVAVSNSGLIRDWPEDKSVLGPPDGGEGQPRQTLAGTAATPGAEASFAQPTADSADEPSAYLVTLPEAEAPAAAPAEQRAAMPAALSPGDFAASFANLPQPSRPMPVAAAPLPTVLLFDSTAFVAPPPAVVTPPAAPPQQDLAELALANAARQPQAELVWTRPPRAEMPPPIALAPQMPPILFDPLARVEGIGETALGEPLLAQSGAELAAASDLAPASTEAALSPDAPPAEAFDGARESAGGNYGLASRPAAAAVHGGRESSARIRKELSAGLARLREREARPVRPEAKRALPQVDQPAAISASAPLFEQSSVDVVSDGRKLGAAAIMVDENQMVSIQLSELISLFEDHLDKPLFVWLKNSAAASQFATLDTLRSAGIDADYDADTAQVSLSLTPER